MTNHPTSAAGTICHVEPPPPHPPRSVERPRLKEGGDFEITMHATRLEQFLRDRSNDIAPPFSEDDVVSELFVIACRAAGISVEPVIQALRYDLFEGIFCPSRECIAAVVVACRTLSGKPVDAEQLFDGWKIDAALASAVPIPSEGRAAHNVRQIFGDGCDTHCRFCDEVVIFTSSRTAGSKATRLTVPESDFRKLTDVLNLSARTARALILAGVETIFHLRQTDERWLASVRAVGKHTLEEIKREAHRAGITLGSLPNPSDEMLPVVRLRPVAPLRRVDEIGTS